MAMEFEFKTAAEWGLIIDPDLRDLLPREEERVRMLEGQIIEEGCRDALVVWKSTGILVDGYTRLDICERNGIPFSVRYMDFETKADAMQWALDNQWNRRNLTIPQRVAAAHKIKDVIKAEARERQATSTGGNNPQLVQKSTQADNGKSRDKLAEIAGVSGFTYSQGAAVIENAPEPIRKAWEREEISTNAAYNFMKLDEDKQNAAIAKIEDGQPVKEVIRSTQKRSQNAVGFTKEDRKNRAETINISSEMRNMDEVPTYDVYMLVDEISINGKNFVDMLGGILRDHADIIADDSKGIVAKAIDESFLNELNEIRRSL